MDNHLNECLPIIITHLQESFHFITSTEKQIVSTVLSTLKCFETYKDLQVHARVKELCPWEALSLESSKKMTAIKRNSKGETISIDSRDLFLIELLSWFKKQFFIWFQEPICKNCPMEQMKFAHYDQCNESEKKWGASQTEVYKCPICEDDYRFPRYNHPLKLLETREGRCGEWANCFAAMCTVFSYEVRKVSEINDHVWIEVFSDGLQRWVHCDPCENAIDTPLMYEAGWNKQITCCTAISDREMQDVTWNYTMNPKLVLEIRRTKLKENWLLDLVMFVTQTLQNKLDPQIVREMNERRVKELVGYLLVPNQKRRDLKCNELVGRQSGSLMWRLARGEINDKEGDLCKKVNFKFKPNSNKLENSCYVIRYNCVKDEYTFGGDQMRGWQSCVYLYKNVDKKVENDWKMTYLARCEDSNYEQMGLLAYEIDLKDLKEASWKLIEIYMLSKDYENGSVKMYISSQPEKIKLKINENERNLIKRDQFPINCSSLRIEIEFSGGRSWQHAQLFRQHLFTDSTLNSLEIMMKF